MNLPFVVCNVRRLSATTTTTATVPNSKRGDLLPLAKLVSARMCVMVMIVCMICKYICVCMCMPIKCYIIYLRSFLDTLRVCRERVCVCACITFVHICYSNRQKRILVSLIANICYQSRLRICRPLTPVARHIYI